MNDNSISLNKFISNTGICSRRVADEWILANRVKINGTVASKGNRVFPNDIVLLDNKPLKSNPLPIYIALNKPRGIVSTTDKKEKNNIIDYINHKERLFPIGRLDKASQGLILLTNDGDIVNKVLRSTNNHEKEYIVKVNKIITNSFLEKMAKGVPILDTITKPCTIKKINDVTFNIILTQGLNRQIRRMCQHFNYEVLQLTRVRIMHISLNNLAYGKWRYLTANEIETLNKLVAHSKKAI
ncbi:MAG: pseudouridine synthase [Chitinophagales bacterium]|nr:pseudouridine synthase [Chitinophagales bacterium]